LGTNNPDSTTFRRCYVNNPTTGNWTFLWGNGQTGRGLTLEDCIIQQSTTGAGLAAVRITDGNYPTTIRNCVFINQGGGTNGRAIAGGSASGTVELYNCAFLNWKRYPFALSTAGGPLIAINNIFHDWLASPTFGSYNAVSVWDYNASKPLALPAADTDMRSIVGR
jgi:WD40 repeat protein